ncbi:MAG: CPBP family intramembrane metalloprotease [Actinomycetia bacterium]|nr:CPBP family intramembrane metalloprotease [Actinomycetes bacterium]
MDPNVNHPEPPARPPLLPTPLAVAEARQQHPGRSTGQELMVFLLLLLVAAVLEFLFTVLAAIPLVLPDPAFQTAVENGGWTNELLDQLFANLAANPLYSLLLLLATSTLIITVIFYSHFIGKRTLPTLGFRRPRAIREYLFGLLAGAALLSGALGICLLTGTITLESQAATIPWGFLALFLLGYAIQGMSEELLCRGYLLVALARRQSVARALLISSAVFAALHGLNPSASPLAIVNLFLFGVLAAVYFLKRGNIWGVAAMHAAWNFAQGNLLGIAVSGTTSPTTLWQFSPTVAGSWVNGGSFGLEGGLAVTFMLVLGICILLLSNSRQSAETIAPADLPLPES